MEWLSDLIKHITISRSFAAAIFVTSAALFFGPRWLPTYLEPLPGGWSAPVMAALVFSAVLLLCWITPVAWKLVIRTVAILPQYLRSRNLSSDESELMLILAELADESLNLKRLNYESGEMTKLEVLELTSSLSKKGLIKINPYEENLISLSATGRARALKIMRAKSVQW